MKPFVVEMRPLQKLITFEKILLGLDVEIVAICYRFYKRMIYEERLRRAARRVISYHLVDGTAFLSSVVIRDFHANIFVPHNDMPFLVPGPSLIINLDKYHTVILHKENELEYIRESAILYDLYTTSFHVYHNGVKWDHPCANGPAMANDTINLLYCLIKISSLLKS